MTLLELLQDLTYGELSQLKIGEFIPGEFESEPDPTRYAQLISSVNLGLKQIYKEFFLRSEEHFIQLYAQLSTYKLHTDFAQTNVASTEPIKYIMDTVDNPFYNNILKIEEVYDEAGDPIPLNDITEELSIYTPTYRTLQVPYPDDDITIAVQFRATHPPLTYTAGMDPSAIEIELPNSLHEALLLYVSGRLLRSMGGERTVEGDNYFQLFKDSIQVVKNEGLEVQGEPGDWRFDAHGWV